MSEPRRVHPPEKYEGLLDNLVNKEHCFETKHAAMMFAAALGYYLQREAELGKAGEGIRWQIFERTQDTPFMFALALARDGSISVLEETRRDDLVEAFEQYAAAGLQYLQENVVAKPGEVLDNILLLMAEARKQYAPPVPGLEALSPADMDLLTGL